jgi:hypothetical protein
LQEQPLRQGAGEGLVQRDVGHFAVHTLELCVVTRKSRRCSKPHWGSVPRA